MVYVVMLNGLPIAVLESTNGYVAPEGAEIQSAWDWNDIDFTKLEDLARRVTAMTGRLYLACRYTSRSPNRDLVEVPKVGDKVSYAFNGDCYPDGEIVKITPKLHVLTSTGSRYRRFKETGGWRKEGGTWSLVRGHIETQNREL